MHQMLQRITSLPFVGDPLKLDSKKEFYPSLCRRLVWFCTWSVVSEAIPWPCVPFRERHAGIHSSRLITAITFRVLWLGGGFSRTLAAAE